MSELRLVPPAVVVWLTVMATILTGAWQAGLGVLAVAAVVLKFAGLGGPRRQVGQVVVSLAVGCGALVLAWARVLSARSHALTGAVGRAAIELEGRVVGEPKTTSTGATLIPLEVAGYPQTVPVFVEQREPLRIDVGSALRCRARVVESDFPGIGSVTANVMERGGGEISVDPPTGFAGHVAHVHRAFAEAATLHLGPSSEGLVPGMVLGDTALQSPAERQLYVETGLSHLSAVSGSNVAIVTSLVVVVARLAGMGPRYQVALAGAALLGFCALVGAEPSVLRAGVMGMVALVSVVAATRAEPTHSLALAVIALLYWDSNLSVNYGFALSVAATCGIVWLSPILAGPLIGAGLPRVVAQAIGVAVAADVVTLPIVALMAGKVATVSALANVLAAPAVAPVTVLGLAAAALALVPAVGVDWLAALPLRLAEPCSWWIHHVALACYGLPRSTLPVPGGVLGAGWVAVAGAWMIYSVSALGLRRTCALAGVLLCGFLCWGVASGPGPEVVPVRELVAVDVDTLPRGYEPPQGTQVVIVWGKGSGTGRGSGFGRGARAREYPTVTQGGVPVLYPNRDGEVKLYSDGTQHASDGRF